GSTLIAHFGRRRGALRQRLLAAIEHFLTELSDADQVQRASERGDAAIWVTCFEVQPRVVELSAHHADQQVQALRARGAVEQQLMDRAGELRVAHRHGVDRAAQGDRLVGGFVDGTCAANSAANEAHAEHERDKRFAYDLTHGWAVYTPILCALPGRSALSSQPTRRR